MSCFFRLNGVSGNALNLSATGGRRGGGRGDLACLWRRDVWLRGVWSRWFGRLAGAALAVTSNWSRANNWPALSEITEAERGQQHYPKALKPIEVVVGEREYHTRPFWPRWACSGLLSIRYVRLTPCHQFVWPLCVRTLHMAHSQRRPGWKKIPKPSHECHFGQEVCFTDTLEYACDGRHRFHNQHNPRVAQLTNCGLIWHVHLFAHCICLFTGWHAAPGPTPYVGRAQWNGHIRMLRSERLPVILMMLRQL